MRFLTTVFAVLAITQLAGSRALASVSNDENPAAGAVLKDASGMQVGHVYLQQTPTGVLLKVDLRGATPGVHAFHIHEIGMCEAPSFESAGGHFAPDGREHGFLNSGGPHAGDLPNVHVPASGNLSFEYLVQRVTLAPGRGSLLDRNGSSLVLHRDLDDYRTSPAGDAGDRFACGVIVR